MHQIVSLKIEGSSGWTLGLNKVSIGKMDFTPKARNAKLDSGTNMMIFGKQDYKYIVDELCDYIAHSRTNMTCIGQFESVGSARPVQITGATRDAIMAMPHIKLQFDSYNFDVRPELYCDFVPIVEKNDTKNET